MKTLVAGWFSFPDMGASAGDLLARDLVCDWLTRAGRPCEVALAVPFAGGVDWRTVDPVTYDTVVFVCGPFGDGEPLTEFLARFAGRRLLGVNLSMLDDLAHWNPFDALWERDSSVQARPDLVFLAERPLVPVVGRILIDAQPEYGERDRRAEADAAIERLLARREVSVVEIDTRLDRNRTGQRTPAEVESLIGRMDAVLTTRLHGTVLALKHGVPAVVIDSVAGGAKVIRQAEAIGWPHAFVIDRLDDAVLAATFDHCLTAAARHEAAACRERARAALATLPDEFAAALAERPRRGATERPRPC